MDLDCFSVVRVSAILLRTESVSAIVSLIFVRSS